MLVALRRREFSTSLPTAGLYTHLDLNPIPRASS